MKKFLPFLLVVFLGGMSNCASDQLTSSYKGLAISKETAVAIARTAKTLHQNNVINDDQLKKVKDGYEAGQRAQAAVVEALKESLDAGQLPQDNEKYLAAINTFTKAMREFTLLAIDLGILDASGKMKS